MTAAATIAAVCASVTFEQALHHHGHSTPQRGNRMACPIHGGRNPSAFVMGDDTFRCHNCDAHGDVVDLERALGGGTIKDALQRLAERHGLGAGTIDPATVRRRQRRAKRLNDWHRRRANAWARVAHAADTTVERWQCNAGDADDVWWDEARPAV